LELRWLSARELRAEWLGSDELAPPRGPALHAGLCSLFHRCQEWAHSVLGSPASSLDVAPLRHGLRPHAEAYDEVTVVQMLRMMQCERVLKVWEDYYRSDPLYNDTGVEDAPPVRRVTAIFGINCKTEVMCALRVNTHRSADKGNVRTRFVPDEEAVLTPGTDLARSCSISGGVVYEEPGGETPSGDGTVPFCSLRRSSTWAGQVEYREHRLEGSPHTLNMFDPRFHNLVLDILARLESA